MATVRYNRDRTQEWRAIVKAKSGTPSSILRDVKKRSEFAESAKAICDAIHTTHKRVMQTAKHYVSPTSAMTDAQRDEFDGEMRDVLSECGQSIDNLKQIAEECKGKIDNKDTTNHKMGMILILYQHLGAVTELAGKLKDNRFEKSRASRPRPPKAASEISIERVVAEDAVEVEAELGEGAHQLVKENDQLLLDCQLELAREVESKMMDISALSHMFASKILQQSKEIELLLENAVEATENVRAGNKQLDTAIRRGVDSRMMILFFLLVMSFCLWFLDQYY